jgi:hypothetical protein
MVNEHNVWSRGEGGVNELQMLNCRVVGEQV